MKSINALQHPFIVKRANELQEKYPEKAYLFEIYLKSQQAVRDELEHEITGITLLLQV